MPPRRSARGKAAEKVEEVKPEVTAETETTEVKSGEGEGKPLGEWSNAEVVEWVKTLGTVFAKYADSFTEQGVDGDMLVEMDEETLENELKIGSKMHRKKILKSIEALKWAAVESKPETKKRKAPAKKTAAAKAASTEDAEEGAPKKAKTESATPAAVSSSSSSSSSAAAAAASSSTATDTSAVPAEVKAAAKRADDKKAENIEIVFSFDTTGSMYPCLTQVRRGIKETVTRLLKEIPHIRIGIIAHGDYQDLHETYTIKVLNFTSDVNTLTEFVSNVGSTCGYDGDECYELVLRDVQDLSWSPRCENRSLVLIGDSNPHPLHSNNPFNIDWKVEAQKLADKNIHVYAVHALGRPFSRAFYQDVARITNGLYLELAQFSSIVDLVIGICFRENSQQQLQNYEDEVKKSGRMTRDVINIFDKLAGRAPTAAAVRPDDLQAVTPGRFQVMNVDSRVPIKQFAQDNGLVFKVGRGFYEFTKPENISANKEVVLMDKATGDMFSGAAARKLIGLDAGGSGRLKPAALENFRVFVQSTSYNRVLVPGAGFLYEVDESK